jgi:hypothetical protein
VVLIALLLIVQVGVVVRDALALASAAREGVRAAAITSDDDEVAVAVRASAGPLDAGRIEFDVDPAPDDRRRDEPVTVTLRYTERLRIPIVDRIVTTELPLRATATMRLERSSDAGASPSPSIGSPSPSPSPPTSTPGPPGTPLPPPTATPGAGPSPSLSPMPSPGG